MKKLIALTLCLMATHTSAAPSMTACPALAQKLSISMLSLEISEYDELRTCVSEMMAIKVQAQAQKPWPSRLTRPAKLEDAE